MTHTITLDVECPRCAFTGPAPLIAVEETEHFREHWTVVCPDCGRGWVVELGSGT